ncbi:helix-turn-helix domain-containing protein [Billgrantia lactosivorans]|uniref:helix-turn-helix domain-containing protein n=1 Tax=Billgrantia lactosivorans TaxID=2185141 RepID=UPI000DAE6BD9|nr:AraC family transcriptional regulator [Halomonas lactosivorans]
MNTSLGTKAAVVLHADALDVDSTEQYPSDVPLESVEAVRRLIVDAQNVLRSDSETAIVRLSLAIDLLNHADQSSSARNRFRGGLASWQIKRLDSFIVQHIDSAIRTTQLAAALNLSVSYFSHAFKQAMGVAPQVYVAHKRIELARQVMLTSRMPLAEIALDHGFCDQSHFSRTFRRETGLTPQKWRQIFG